MPLLFLFWYCYDDHLAAALNVPGLGDLPWWVVLLFALSLAPVTFRGDK